MAAALLTLDAQITIASAAKIHKISLQEFFVNDGLVKNRLAKNEILTEIIVPAAARGLAGAYQKFRLRGSVDYPLAGVAVTARKLDDTVGDLKVALTAVNPLPLLLPHPWNSGTPLAPEVIAAIQKTAQRTAKPLKTSASSMDYRRHMVSVLLQRALEPLA